MSDPLLLEIVAAIGAGRITIGPIHSESERIEGYAVDKGKRRGRVYINPQISFVDTAIHELLHRLRPRWSEGTVRRRTGKLMRALSDQEIDKVYELIQVSAKVRKRAVVIEAD